MRDLFDVSNSYEPSTVSPVHLKSPRALNKMSAEKRHQAEAEKLRSVLGAITAHACQGRTEKARTSLVNVRAQLEAAQAAHGGRAPAEVTYAQVNHELNGQPRTQGEAFRVATDNLVRAFVADDYGMAARVLDSLLVRLKKFK